MYLLALPWPGHGSQAGMGVNLVYQSAESQVHRQTGEILSVLVLLKCMRVASESRTGCSQSQSSFCCSM